MSPDFFPLLSLPVFVQSPSLSVLAEDSQFVNLCKIVILLVELLGEHNQHMQVKAVKNIREKVLGKQLTL